MDDFDVFISKGRSDLPLSYQQRNFESYIKGAGFQIYDPNENLMTMTFTYPEVTTIDTFLYHSRWRAYYAADLGIWQGLFSG